MKTELKMKSMMKTTLTTRSMSTRGRAVPLLAIVLLLAGTTSCGAPGADHESATDQQALSEPAAVTRCDLHGVWTLTETPEAAEGCDETWAPFIDAYLQIQQREELLEVKYVPQDSAALSCSGLPADDTCSFEMTCEGKARAKDVEAALELVFTPDSDSVSGTRRLEVVETGCRMTVSIEGRRRPEPESAEAGTP